MTQDISRSDVRLDNWRTAPFSRWAFQNVSEIVPSAVIRSNRLFEEAVLDLGALAGLPVAGLDGSDQPLEAFLEASDTDGFVVMRQGRLVAEWYAGHCDPLCPHIIFSVSKSLTALLAGILVGQGRLSLSEPIVTYVPETQGSAYADATVQQLLDMELSLEFEENYLDQNGAFNRYRRATGWTPDNPADLAPDLKTFLCSIPKGNGGHGHLHAYRSPNTDMAGIVLERASGVRLPTLLSGLLWQPLGASSDAMITVDRCGTSRAAGGMSVTARDLTRVGDVVRRNGGGIVPAGFVADLWTGGNRDVWKNGDQATLFPDGRYRNYWYASGAGELVAIGIHGQWVWIDPATETVIVKLSSQPLPVDAPLDQAIVSMLRRVSAKA